jgi:D-sedoheptulose 7-phosphate isomerase
MPQAYPHIDNMVREYPALDGIRPLAAAAADALIAGFRGGGKLLVCGNGGSCADADHIVGELAKAFLRARPLPEAVRARIRQSLPDGGAELAEALQGALPAISLAAHTSLLTAFGNDVAAVYAYAQQVVAYGRPGDMLLGISTSGNARNVAYAVAVAQAQGLRTIGLTGQSGGRLASHVEIAIRVPATVTHRIQELHLPVYHALCAEVEEALFGQG